MLVYLMAVKYRLCNESQIILSDANKLIVQIVERKVAQSIK